MWCNYVYEHHGGQHQIRRCLSHTQLLQDCGLELPKHTFYGQHLRASALPSVRNIYYLDVDLYRYFIGRADHPSTRRWWWARCGPAAAAGQHPDDRLPRPALTAEQPKLGRYMFNYLAMMMAISSIFLTIADTPECLGKKTQLWEYLRTVAYRDLSQDEVPGRHRLYQFPGYQGRRLSVGLYRLAPGRSIVQLNV